MFLINILSNNFSIELIVSTYLKKKSALSLLKAINVRNVDFSTVHRKLGLLLVLTRAQVYSSVDISHRGHQLRALLTQRMIDPYCEYKMQNTKNLFMY